MLGLDQPVHIRYVSWLAQTIQGNLGFSFRSRRAVSLEVGDRLPNTLLLGGASKADRAAAEKAAESAFLEAIRIARRQEAKSHELRAAASLSRLLQGQGRVGEARTRLTDVYGWFTEGLGIPDLKDARDLLGQLDRGSRKRRRPANP